MSDKEPFSCSYNDASVEELVRANAKSNATMAALVEGVKKETAARDRKLEQLAENNRAMHRLGWLLAVAMSFLLIMAIFNAVSITTARRNAAQTAEIARDTRSTNQLLLDCLNATGSCGSANAAQQTRLLDEIKKYELTVLYCVRINPQVDDESGEQFLACVERLYPGGPKLNGR